MKRHIRSKVFCNPPFLRRIWIEYPKIQTASSYPFSLPIFNSQDFEIRFTKPVTIIVGENGSGKSTILEGIAKLAGYDEDGGGKGYKPTGQSQSAKVSGGRLSEVLRAGWWPKVAEGWFFRAENFFSVARYLDQAAMDVNALPPDFLSHSHGEGFLRFFEERMRKRGVFILDEPDSALSLNRQLDLLKLITDIQKGNISQMIIATHSPIIMSCPDVQIIEISDNRINYVTLEELRHFEFMRDFYKNPVDFISKILNK